MRYRVGGPLIDGLMAELGMSGDSLDGAQLFPVAFTPIEYAAAAAKIAAK